MLGMLLVLVGLADAAPRFGAGLVVGDPTGVSLGWRGNAWSGAQAGVGVDGSRFDIHADYLQSVAVLKPSKEFQLPLYVGAGAGFATAEKGVFGAPAGAFARLPIGASLLFEEVPVELFAQIVPTVRVFPSTAFGLDLGVGGRYYF